MTPTNNKTRNNFQAARNRSNSGLITVARPDKFYAVGLCDRCRCRWSRRWGCTVIFWRNHVERWPAPYTPTTQYDSVFGFEIPGKPDLTLMGALKLNGFNNLNKMVKQGTAAFLNAAFLDDDLAYPHSKGTVIRNVEDGLDPQYIQSAAYGDDNDFKERMKSLRDANNQICPFIDDADDDDFKAKLEEWLKEHRGFWAFFQKWHQRWLR